MSKGRNLEKRSHKWLEERGYIVHTVQAQARSFRYDEKLGRTVPIFRKNLNNDLFNLFDHVGVLSEPKTSTPVFNEVMEYTGIEEFPKVIFVQTKSQIQYGKQLEKYKGFPFEHCYIFAWKRRPNGRYGDPVIQYIGSSKEFKKFDIKD